MATSLHRNLLATPARIITPWVSVRIGSYTFGFQANKSKGPTKNSTGTYEYYNVQFPNYVQSLSVTKINGQVNQYTLSMNYPVRPGDDPNFMEKVFSSVSDSRKIVFSYGDISMPNYIYKDEEAVITKVTAGFKNMDAGNMSPVLQYTVSATSVAALGLSSTINEPRHYDQPSKIIKDFFRANRGNLQSLFTGMDVNDLDKYIEGDDEEVEISAATNVSIIDYLLDLVSYMIPRGSKNTAISTGVYVLTVHDETVYDALYSDVNNAGPYFKVSKIEKNKEVSDAYEINIGVPDSNILVTNFSVENSENYSIYYNYQEKIPQQTYIKRLDADGTWIEEFAPELESRNDHYKQTPASQTWWTKVTQYPYTASISLQGLLRPAQLMSYIRLNVIFPGTGDAQNRKHISSGLYIITSETDEIGMNGFKTTLKLTKISGDNGGTNS